MRFCEERIILLRIDPSDHPNDPNQNKDASKAKQGPADPAADQFSSSDAHGRRIQAPILWRHMSGSEMGRSDESERPGCEVPKVGLEPTLP